MMSETKLDIVSVTLNNLTSHDDDRGSLTEIFRKSWIGDIAPVQWNHVRSGSGVLRGVHAHLRHTDYLVLLQGSLLVGLKDLRPDSETWLRTAMVQLSGEKPQALMIPVGVAHGFYFDCPSTFVYGVTEYWSAIDELGCLWDDPELGIAWPNAFPTVSERDAALPDFATFQKQVEEGLRAHANSHAPPQLEPVSR